MSKPKRGWTMGGPGRSWDELIFDAFMALTLGGILGFWAAEIWERIR